MARKPDPHVYVTFGLIAFGAGLLVSSMLLPEGDTLILQTEMDTADGTVRLIDFMPPRGLAPDVVRIVEGVNGRVPMRMELRLRFDYGRVVPWVRRDDGAIVAVAGPDSCWLRTPVETRGEDLTTVAEFIVEPGDRLPFVLTWQESHMPRHGRSMPITRSGTPGNTGRTGWRNAPMTANGRMRRSAR